MADDDIAVTIEEETKPNGEGGATEGERDAGDDLKAQLAELKAGRERAESDRAAALRRAQQAEAAATQAQREVATVRTEAVEREGESIDAKLAAATEALAAAKSDIVTAGETGDFKKLADAQERLGRASARLERLTEAKTEVDIRKAEAARPAPREQQRQEQGAPDPLDEMAAQGFPRSAKWLREHNEYWTDAKKNARVRAAHFDAVADGIEPESDAYFEFIETKVGLRKVPEPEKKANGADGEVKVKPHTRRAPVAGVGDGGAGAGYNGGGTTVKLTRRQAEAATDGTIVWNYDDPKGKFKKGDPIGHQEMARRVNEQTKQGLYDSSNA